MNSDAAQAYIRQKTRKVSEYFKPTENVRVRDFVREVPGAVGQMFSGTRDFVNTSGKIMGEGLAYATDRNVRDQYKAGNTNILPTISEPNAGRRLFGNAAKSFTEIATAGKIPGLSKMAMSAKLAPRLAAGGAMGYGYGVADEVSKPGPVNRETFTGMNPIVSALAGALMGGMVPSGTKMIGQSAREHLDDIKNYNPANRIRHKVVGVHDMEPTGIYAAGGIPQMGENPHTYRQEVRTTVDPFEPKSYLARVLMGKQSPMGMTIAGVKPDANGQYPTGSFSARFDKKPRIEIGDEGAKFTGFGANASSGVNQKKLSDVFKHDALFEKYPDLKDINVIEGNASSGSTGSYNPATRTIVLDRSVFSPSRQESGGARSTLLHEIQHAIQQKEGFARGGNPSQMADTFGENGILTDRGSALSKEIDKLKKSNGWLDINNADNAQWDKFKNSPLYKKVIGLEDELKKETIDPNKLYQRLGGELESRSVQRRMNMTPKERLSSDPYAAEAKATGIKGVDDVITRFDGGVNNATDPLLQEARSGKYANAEEFVKAQGEPVYHGTNAKFYKFDVTVNKNDYGTWFTPDKKSVVDSGKGIIKERIIRPGIKIVSEKEAGYPLTADSLKKIAETTDIRGVRYSNGSVQLFHPNEDLITKSQLTDLWKKAHNKK